MENEKISKFDVPSYIQGSSQIKAFFEGQAQAFKFLAQSLETGQMVTPAGLRVLALQAHQVAKSALFRVPDRGPADKG